MRDATGRAYHQPFLGGFNVPRPQLVDIDVDGDLDLFIQEDQGRVMFFENTGREGDGKYKFRSEQFGGIDVGEWYRFADLDLDGDYDLLSEQPYSYVRYLRNEGGDGGPRFVEVADSLTDIRGEAIFSDRQNIPNVTDIDCDGKPDLFVGRLDGTISRYEWSDNDVRGAPRFRFMEDRFQGIEIIGQFMGSRHGANTLFFADLDDDGDQDLLWGDYFEPGLLFIENTGTCQRLALGSQPMPFPPNDPIKTSGYNAPAPGDLDADGDLDLLIGVLGGAFNANTTTADNLYLLEQESPGRFTLSTRRFLYTVDVGAESIPVVADIDGDGDAELMLSNQIEPNDSKTSAIYVFDVVRDGRDPVGDGLVWQMADTLMFKPAYHYAPALGDLDGDGDLDMVLGTWRDELAWYRNDVQDGAYSFVVVDSVAAKLTRGSNAVPALVDIDADGDLDLFVGETSGTLNYYRNEGSAADPDFVLVSDEYGGIDVGRRCFPVFEDLDADGDYDMVLGRAAGGVLVYRNDGSVTGPEFVPVEAESASGFIADVLALPLPAYSAPVFVDLDGDGDRDVLTGGQGGGLMYWELR
ncbi:MAG: VCBS repeat-containing protein [Rhodothermales bacterium]|nr:VCBS repeat-containing protein [Rhodothermales bacterium]